MSLTLSEALVKTLLREWAYRFAYPTSAHRARALDRPRFGGHG